MEYGLKRSSIRANKVNQFLMRNWYFNTTNPQCRRPIAFQPTDYSAPLPHPASQDEAQASLRAELQRQIEQAQSRLETQLAELKRVGLLDTNPALAEALHSQLQVLTALGNFLPSASGATLAQVRAEVATSVAAANSLGQQAQTIVALADASQAADHMMALAIARDDARHTAEDFLHDFYEKRIFDPYLHFDTLDDERAYREREALRRQAIEEAMAKHTPNGDLQALQLEKDQLRDAGKHGATASPQFQTYADELDGKYDALSRAMPTAATKTPDEARAQSVQPETTSPVKIDPGILAALKNSGSHVADQNQDGHGLTVAASSSAIYRT